MRPLNEVKEALETAIKMIIGGTILLVWCLVSFAALFGPFILILETGKALFLLVYAALITIWVFFPVVFKLWGVFFELGMDIVE